MSTSAGFRIHLATTQGYYVSAHPFTHQGRSELWPCPPPWPPLLEKRFATICVRAGAVRAATRALEYRREDWRLRRAVGRIRGIVSVVNGFQCRSDSEVRKWLERASKLFLRSSGSRGSSRSDVHPISPIRPVLFGHFRIHYMRYCACPVLIMFQPDISRHSVCAVSARYDPLCMASHGVTSHSSSRTSQRRSHIALT